MKIILFDTPKRAKLYPLTLTRAVAGLRAGILTVKESWEQHTRLEAFVYTADYLQHLYPEIEAGEYLFIDACIAPSDEQYAMIMNLQPGEALSDADGLVAGRATIEVLPRFASIPNSLFSTVKQVQFVERIQSCCDLFKWNERIIRGHFSLVTYKRVSQPVPESVQVVNPANIFIEEGAKLSFCILNAENGPIYIGKDCLVMEGTVIRGPFAMCEGSTLKIGSKIYGGTTLGPYCVAGGEIKNAILMGYSNKAHEGYLGDSVIGEWCNLGAGTSNSNVKNTASDVKVWNSYTQQYISSGMKCGLVMGDYSRTAINTSINTGTVVGICCNVFGEGLTPKVIPDFTWGTKGLTRYELDKAIKDITNWKQLKNRNFDEDKVQVLRHIFEHYND